MLLKLLFYTIFYTGILRFVNSFVNRFQIHTITQEKLQYPFITKRRSRNVQILVYHRVNNEFDPFFPAIPISVFKRQMEFIASNFNVCPLDDVVEMMKNNDVPENAISVTFDDGYRDIYLNAFPILNKLAIPATIFIATGVIDSEQLLWHDRVFSAFRGTLKPSLEWMGMLHSLNTTEEKLKTQREILRSLRSMNNDNRLFFVNSLVDRLSNRLPICKFEHAQDLMLSWEDIKIMHHGGISVGSHSITHPILSQTSLDEKFTEIHISKTAIEKVLGTPINSFSYPSGRQQDFDESTKYLVKEAGYTCAVTMIYGVNECSQDPFELRRGTPWENNIAAFGIKLNYYKFRS